MKKINSKRFQFYIWVGSAWLLLWILSSLVNYPRTFIQHALNEIWLVFYITAAHIIFFEFSFPFIKKTRSNIIFNILIGMMLVAIHLAIVSFGLYGWSYLGIQLQVYTTMRHVTLSGGFIDEFLEAVSYQAQAGVTSTFFFGFAKLFYDNLNLKRTTQQLQLEKKEAELNFLKSQTNPHFLFNTLNNIYTLAGDNNALAQESILRLSKILRFMLYETNREFINVEEEVEIINDYIELEKLRYDDSLHINFKHEVEDMKQPLPPLLLIPLVENAFKHGIAETENQPFVDIHLSTKQQQLLFVVKNSTGNLPGEKIVKENIGLSNLRRQLQLLYTSYHLSVVQQTSEFTATLKINLSSHV